MIMVTSILTASMFSIIMTSTPMTLGLNILISSIFMSFYIYMFLSMWYAFLLILIYIGGMLMMFAYMVSLTPNIYLMMESHTMTILTTTMMMVPLMYTSYLMVPMNSYSNCSSNLYCPSMFCSFMMMILILLIVLVMVSKMVLTSKGPLRPFMYA
nr:TPA: NADH dehydrogenase subunit 6 [Bdellodrilus illuminatus]